jgi:hypothetical protein
VIFRAKMLPAEPRMVGGASADIKRRTRIHITRRLFVDPS